MLQNVEISIYRSIFEWPVYIKADEENYCLFTEDLEAK